MRIRPVTGALITFTIQNGLKRKNMTTSALAQSSKVPYLKLCRMMAHQQHYEASDLARIGQAIDFDMSELLMAYQLGIYQKELGRSGKVASLLDEALPAPERATGDEFINYVAQVCNTHPNAPTVDIVDVICAGLGVQRDFAQTAVIQYRANRRGEANYDSDAARYPAGDANG